jgi:hypothetical protein
MISRRNAHVLAAFFIYQALETVGQPTAKKREPPGADRVRVVEKALVPQLSVSGSEERAE